jgi:CheY-like chemotaxis protein/two-component sensor histidine kinase
MSTKQLEYANVILASGRDLLRLLNSILDLAKAESGTATVEISTISTAELRRELLREFEPVAHERGVGFSVTLAQGCPSDFDSDALRLRQILKNLLVNAFKFTDRGEVRLQVGVAEGGWNREIASLGEAPLVLSFAVRDTGIGVESDQKERIFEAFAQGDGSTGRLYGGTGLGLSISRELVRLLGGEITLVSSVGAGSIFTVYVPLQTFVPGLTEVAFGSGAPAQVIADRRATSDSSTENGRGTAQSSEDVARGGVKHPFEGMRVLVVDDDARNVFALTALLELAHAEVSSAESGRAALSRLGGVSVDIILMDIMMPGMDGYETMRAIRALENYRDVPIIAVTGRVVAGERQRCIDAGANGYVPKPVDSAELLSAITRWLPVPARNAVIARTS